MRTAVLVDVGWTASGRGKPGGARSGVHPADVLAQNISGLLGRHEPDPAWIDDVLAGCVVQAGDQALDIARTASRVTAFLASDEASYITGVVLPVYGGVAM